MTLEIGRVAHNGIDKANNNLGKIVKNSAKKKKEKRNMEEFGDIIFAQQPLLFGLMVYINVKMYYMVKKSNKENSIIFSTMSCPTMLQPKTF